MAAFGAARRGRTPSRASRAALERERGAARWCRWLGPAARARGPSSSCPAVRPPSFFSWVLLLYIPGASRWRARWRVEREEVVGCTQGLGGGWAAPIHGVLLQTGNQADAGPADRAHPTRPQRLKPAPSARPTCCCCACLQHRVSTCPPSHPPQLSRSPGKKPCGEERPPTCNSRRTRGTGAPRQSAAAPCGRLFKRPCLEKNGAGRLRNRPQQGDAVCLAVASCATQGLCAVLSRWAMGLVGCAGLLSLSTIK